ncbi:hypothetical protein [Spirosoma sp.]|uniref:hypothetical protein n=1 Tax=Spirosoma sp. TaxID=1899569 RepID=UPI003B3B4ACF
MIRLILFAWMTLVWSCQKEPVAQAGPERTEAAFIFENGLAYDGCEEMVRLEADSLLNKFTGFKPSPATLPLVQQALKDVPSGQHGRAVMIRFFETGNQVFLQCGWGSRQELPEIEVLEIKPR